MANSTQRVATVVVLLLGLLHTSLTPLFYPTFNESQLWFAGTGLGLLLLAALNWVAGRMKGTDRIVAWLCHGANGVMTIYSVLVVIALAEVQAYLTVVAMGVLLGSGIVLDRQLSRRQAVETA